MHTQVLEKPRYKLLDELRGFMVLCMVVYHGFLSVDMAVGSPLCIWLFDFFTPAEPFFAGGFIMLSGICCHFSHSNLRRGSILFLIALGVNAVTILADLWFGMDIAILFGILNFLSVCMLFVGVFNFALKKLNPIAGMIIFGLLFAAAVIFVSKPDFSYIKVESEWLFPFGFYSSGFSSADYFPLLPWTPLYLFGYYFGRSGIIERFPKFFMWGKIPPLDFLGRHAIWVYIIHQPVIYGTALLIGGLLK